MRIVLSALLCLLSSASGTCQDVATCNSGTSPVTLTIIATATPPPHIGLRIALSNLRPKNESHELRYKLAQSGRPLEFPGICPGDYLVVVRSDVGDCGYRAEKKIHVREKGKQKLRLRVRWKKGDICE